MERKKVLSTPVNKQTMAEQMAEKIKDLILSGHLESGEVLPTEPELAKQFGVSRAVVRDATRILMAKGLVVVQHGRGVFVTEPHNPAFGDALLLALQRSGASVWDVEQFEMLLFPEVLALAAEFANDEDIQNLERSAKNYLDYVEYYHNNWFGRDIPQNETKEMSSRFRTFIQTIFIASKNKLIEQLALPLLQLRNMREWDDNNELTAKDYIQSEQHYIGTMLDLIKGRNPNNARKLSRQTMNLPPEAIREMKKTPVGEMAIIKIKEIEHFRDHIQKK